MRDAFVRRLPEYRGHDFRHPVKIRTISEADLRKFLLENLAKEYPDERFEKDSLVLGQLGFTEPGIDLKKLSLDVYSEGIAGFYDTDTKKLYLIAEPPPAPDEKKKKKK